MLVRTLCHLNFISFFFCFWPISTFLMPFSLPCTHPFFPLLRRFRQQLRWYLQPSESLRYENAIKFMTLFIFSFCSFRYYYSLLFQYYNNNNVENESTWYQTIWWCICVCIGLYPTSPVIFNKLCLFDKFSTNHFWVDIKLFEAKHPIPIYQMYLSVSIWVRQSERQFSHSKNKSISFEFYR